MPSESNSFGFIGEFSGKFARGEGWFGEGAGAGRDGGAPQPGTSPPCPSPTKTKEIKLTNKVSN